jgi:hypothetical protein
MCKCKCDAIKCKCDAIKCKCDAIKCKCDAIKCKRGKVLYITSGINCDKLP